MSCRRRWLLPPPPQPAPAARQLTSPCTQAPQSLCSPGMTAPHEVSHELFCGNLQFHGALLPAEGRLALTCKTGRLGCLQSTTENGLLMSSVWSTLKLEDILPHRYRDPHRVSTTAARRPVRPAHAAAGAAGRQPARRRRGARQRHPHGVHQRVHAVAQQLHPADGGVPRQHVRWRVTQGHMSHLLKVYPATRQIVVGRLLMALTVPSGE